MADRMDVVSFKQTATGKTFAIRLGSAVEGKKPGTWNLYLDAIPAPVEGQYKLSIVPPREQRAQRQPGEDDGDTGSPF